MPTSFLKYLFLFLVLGCSSPLFSQSSNESFGKNRVQFTNFKWSNISTPNFDIYFYNDGLALAKKAVSYAEDDYERVTEAIGYIPDDKITIILYQSESDKLQSNIGLSNQEIMIGGQTVLVKTKIEVAFKGTQLQLMKDISYELAYTIINTVMYGGNIKDIVKSSYLMNLPDWFIKGASSYIAEDWSQEMDNVMRDKVIYGKLKNPTRYEGEEAKVIGHSIWNFIAKEYGEENIFGILGLARTFRNERESIESNLGVEFRDFVKDWEAYYRAMNIPISKTYSAWEDSLKFVKARKGSQLYGLTVNKEGTSVAYVQNYKGKYKVKVKNSLTKISTTLLRGGYKRSDQSIDYLLPVTSWKTPSVLGLIYTKRGKTYLRLCDVVKHKKSKSLLVGFNQVYSFSFSSDGSQLLLSADKLGQTDIFIHTISSGKTINITNDAYDDIDPIFTSDKKIIFSSNRLNDTLLIDQKKLPEYTDNYNLYQFSSVGKSYYQKLTFSNNNYMPKVFSDSSLYFLNDEMGIVNICSLNFSDNRIAQMTNQSNDITSYSYSPLINTFSIIVRNKDRDCVYKKKSLVPIDKDKLIFTERKNMVRKYEAYTNEPSIDTVNFTFNSNDEVGFEQLVFESEVKLDSLKMKELNPISDNKVYAPIGVSAVQKYRNRFSTDKVVSNLMMDPMRGTGIFVDVGLSDILGNHRFDAGGFIGLDFISTKYFGEYRYVKKNIDFKLRYDRQTLNANFIADGSPPIAVDHRYIMNALSGTMSFPFSVNQRISFTPSYIITSFRESSYYYLSNSSYSNLSKRAKTMSYEAMKAEYVYDNTLVTGINMLKGTRLKMSAEYFVSNQTSKRNFGLLYVDFRKYIPIHKELIWANRVSYGHYFGPSPKMFMLGGMDNWLIHMSEFTSDGDTTTETSNPLNIDRGVENTDLLFTRFATSVRGFNYNAQYGTKYLLFNSELRLPVIQYFYNGTISSNFLRNLQFVAFVDAGSAYSGPFSLDYKKVQSTVVVKPFSVVVNNYESPFLIGYGGGVRTMFLGYYIKADLGWGIQNGIKLDPKFYLTFGYDF